MCDSKEVLRQLLEEKLKDMTEASKKSNKKGDFVDYYHDDDLWDDWYEDEVNDNMTVAQIKANVEAHLKDVAYDSENNDTAKVAVFGAIGTDNQKPLDYNAVEKAHGVKHLKDLTNNDIVEIAVENKVSLEDAKAMIREAIDRKIADNAKSIREKTKNDANLARQYLSAKFDGDDATMKAIESKLQQRAENGEDVSYILDKTEIPMWKRAIKGVADYLGGESQMNRYREQIANPTAEDNDYGDYSIGPFANPFTSGRGRAFTADAVYAIPTGRVLKGVKVVENGAKAVNKLTKGGGLIKRGGVQFAKEGGFAGAKELERELVAGEDMDWSKIGQAGLWGGGVPTASSIGIGEVYRVPILGPAIEHVTNSIKKGSQATVKAGQIATRNSNAKKYFQQVNPNKGQLVQSAQFASAIERNPLAKEFADDYNKMLKAYVDAGVNEGGDAIQLELDFQKRKPQIQYVNERMEKELKQTSEALNVDENELAQKQLDFDEAMDNAVDNASLNGEAVTSNVNGTTVRIDPEAYRAHKKVMQDAENKAKGITDADTPSSEVPPTEQPKKEWKPHNRIDPKTKTTSHTSSTSVERVPKTDEEMAETAILTYDKDGNLIGVEAHGETTKPSIKVQSADNVISTSKDLGPDVKPSEITWDPNYRTNKRRAEGAQAERAKENASRKSAEEAERAFNEAKNNVAKASAEYHDRTLTNNNPHIETLMNYSDAYVEHNKTPAQKVFEDAGERAVNVGVTSSAKEDGATYENERKKVQREAEEASKRVKKHIHNSKKKEEPQVSEDIEMEEERTFPITPWEERGEPATWEEQQTPLYHQWKIYKLTHGNNGLKVG